MSSRQLWMATVAVAAIGAAMLLIPVATDPDARSPDSSAAPVASTAPPNASEPPANGSTPKPPEVTASNTTPDITPPTTTAQRTHPMHSQAPAPPKPARRIIVGFAQDFTTPGRGHTDWLARVSRWVSTDLAKQYRATAVSRIPAGNPVQMQTVSVNNRAVDVLIRYDTGLVLNCRAESRSDGWVVTAADPAALP